MKKQILYTTSAIALGCAMAAPVAAQEWDVRVGGFFSGGLAYADVSGPLVTGRNLNGVDMFQSAEIFFLPSITLDNGLTFGVNIQLEGNTSGDQIDESFLTISSDTLGTITLGNENSEGYRMSSGAPTVTNMWINSPSISGYIPFSLALTGGPTFRTTLISSFAEVGANNDAARLSYRTPDFNGFQVGVSYARDGRQDSNASVDTGVLGVQSDIFDIGASYSGSFGAVDVSVSGRYGRADVSGAGHNDVWGLGGSLGFGGFTVGGAYGANSNALAQDTAGWSLGASYDAAGPWSFAVSTYQGKATNAGDQSEYQAYKLGAARNLGPGVKLDIFAIKASAENPVNVGVHGYTVGTLLNLSF